MENTLTAEEFLSKKYGKYDKNDKNGNINGNFFTALEKEMIEFAKLHVEAALKEASGNATATIKGNCSFICDYFINKESILNAYPLSNIK